MFIDPRMFDFDDRQKLLPDHGSPRARESNVDEVNENPVSSAEIGLGTTECRELVMLETTRGELDSKPYLTHVPRSYIGELIIFRWLEDLVSKAGFAQAVDAITYYASINWISEPVVRSLREYLSGFSEPVDESRQITLEDHVRSLLYIARLASLTNNTRSD